MFRCHVSALPAERGRHDRHDPGHLVDGHPPGAGRAGCRLRAALGLRRADRIGGRRGCRHAGCRPASRSTWWCSPPMRSTSSSPAAASSPAARSTWCVRRVAVAVRAGAPRPDIAHRRRVAARRAGRRQHRLFDRPERRGAHAPVRALGHRRRDRSRASSRRRRACRWARWWRSGEVALGFQQLSELMHLEGIDRGRAAARADPDHHHILRRRVRRLGAGRGRARACSPSWPRRRRPRPSAATAWSPPEHLPTQGDKEPQ